jgi:hypothetical protein
MFIFTDYLKTTVGLNAVKIIGSCLKLDGEHEHVHVKSDACKKCEKCKLLKLAWESFDINSEDEYEDLCKPCKLTLNTTDKKCATHCSSCLKSVARYNLRLHLVHWKLIDDGHGGVKGEDMGKDGKGKDGRCICSECRNTQYIKAEDAVLFKSSERSESYAKIIWKITRNKEFIKKLKINIGTCMDCECKRSITEESHMYFEFDHILTRGPKLANVSSLASTGKPIKRITDELMKTQCIHTDCHAIKTQWRATHDVTMTQMDRIMDCSTKLEMGEAIRKTMIDCGLTKTTKAKYGHLTQLQKAKAAKAKAKAKKIKTKAAKEKAGNNLKTEI